MAENPAKMDEYTLLCERCGYVIEGLPTEGKCPECGKAIAESLPSARVGSAWQQRASFGGWLRSIWLVLAHPVSGWTALRVESKSSQQLFEVHTGCAAGLAAILHTRLKLSAAIHFFDATTTSPVLPWLTVPLVFLGSLGLWYWVFWALVAVERRGIRFIGGRHKWRITPDVALTVCAHASAAWIGAVILIAIGIAVSELPRSYLASFGTAINRNAEYVLAAAPLAGFLLGLTYFESLVYIGIHRCKYANRARPTT